MTTIVLADDHHIVRHGLKAVLETDPDFKVVGEASGGNEAVKLVQQLKPNVLVCDLMMGGTNGFETTRLVRNLVPETNVIILSMYADESYVVEALRAGARGYILKTSPADEMIHAIREVINGNRYLSPSLSDRAFEYYSNKSKGTSDEDLTVRELEVLQLIVQGYTNERIADLWSISRRTVESHRTNLMRKLGLHNQKELKYYVFEHGIAPLPEAPSAANPDTKPEVEATPHRKHKTVK